MPTYSAFGGFLDSDVLLPELPESSVAGAWAWRLRTATSAPVSAAWSVAGEDIVYGSVKVRAYTSESALRLVFDDTGTFDIIPPHRAIRWYPGGNASATAVRADLLGRVLALAALADGCLPLHASAVACDGGAIAVVGPKHAGKSTLALSLVRQGARLITDDTLVVRFDATGEPWAEPGVQQLRVWDDTARRLRTSSGTAAAGISGGPKPTIALPVDERQREAVPLRSCLVLTGTDDPAVDIADRSRLLEVPATMALIRFSRLGPLAGGALGALLLERAAALSRAVAVHEVAARRDLDRLDALAARVAAWHRDAGRAGTAAP